MMFVDDLATDFNSVHFKNKRYNKLQRRKMLKQAHTYDKNKIEVTPIQKLAMVKSKLA